MEFLSEYWPHVGGVVALLDTLIILAVVPWVLLTKRDSTSAMAWCLVVLLVPLLGFFLFWVFGHNHVYRPLRRRRHHRSAFRAAHPPRTKEAAHGASPNGNAEPPGDDLGQLALKVNAFPISRGNAVTLYHETRLAFEGILEAIQEARHHIHLEYYSFRPDGMGTQLLELLTEKARAGVEVRLLYDAVGGLKLKGRHLRPLLDAGGKTGVFLPLNPLQSRIRVNLRTHRKITVVDGRVGFIGGMNIGDEYLGKSKTFGYWRDTTLRLEGPAVAGLQRIFAEDWDFTYREAVNGDHYFPHVRPAGAAVVQVVESGPDQEINSIREVYFAAILSARERLWIASPYFVPDAGLLDALRLARYRGVDVRLLTISKPDHYLSFYAGRYYWADMLAVGAKVYQYTKGMMHSKLMMVDGRWAMVGSANLDNRSLRLNFEAGCILHTPELVADLERAFERDLNDAILLDAASYARRSLASRLVENACRLLSPVL